MRRLFWALLVVTSLVLLALGLRHGGDEIFFAQFNDTGLKSRIIALGLLLVMAGLLLRQRFSNLLASLMIWAAIVAVLALAYTYRFELRDVGDRVLAEIVPGHAAIRGRTVEIARGNSGGFAVVLQVNGSRVPMVIDTGASAVVLTHDAAKTAGLPVEMLNYSVTVDTANGRARAAPVTLDRVSIGSITERSVAALVAQPGQLRLSLLGMSFLNRLERWEVRGDKLVMQAYP